MRPRVPVAEGVQGMRFARMAGVRIGIYAVGDIHGRGIHVALARFATDKEHRWW